MSPTPITRVVRSRLPEHEPQRRLRRRAVAVTEERAYRSGATHLVVEIGSRSEHGEPLGPRRVRQRATRPDADVEGAHVLPEAGVEDPGEILRLPARGVRDQAALGVMAL